MKTSGLTPYLFFNGHCRDVLSFYKNVFGTEISLMTYGHARDQGAGDDPKGCPTGAEDKIIHGALMKHGAIFLMASDTPSEEHRVHEGSNVQIAFNCQTLQEIESVFNQLGEEGEVLAPLHDAFWGDRFGMVKDRYGIFWMLTCERPS